MVQWIIGRFGLPQRFHVQLRSPKCRINNLTKLIVQMASHFGEHVLTAVSSFGSI